MLDFSPLSSSAATGPRPQAGHPLQGPGVLHRDPQMDGTWAPIERGVTTTSSKCPVFKETEGELSLSQMFQTRCQPVIIPATSLPPQCAFRILILCSLRCCAHSALPTLTLSHTPTTLLMQSPKCRRGILSVSVYALLLMKKFTCAETCFDLRVCTFLRGCWVLLLSAWLILCNWHFWIYVQAGKKKLSAASLYAYLHMFYCKKWVFACFVCSVDLAYLWCFTPEMCNMNLY